MKRGGWGRFKDAAIEQGLLLFLRPKLERYGEIKSLELDSSAATVAASILLTGESEPVTISQARYRINAETNKPTVTFYEIKVSREWLQNLLDDFYPEITLKLPEFAARLLA